MKSMEGSFKAESEHNQSTHIWSIYSIIHSNTIIQLLTSSHTSPLTKDPEKPVFHSLFAPSHLEKTEHKQIKARKKGKMGETERKRKREEIQVNVIKVAAICGSLRKASFNRGLLRAAMKICSEEIEELEMEHIDISGLPMMNMDLEVNGKFPPEVEDFRQKICQADAVFFASPEYNYSLTPLLKNALDWGSRRPNVWADKAAAMVSAQGAGRTGQYHLRQIGVYLDLHFINKPELFLNKHEPPAKFNNNGDLIDHGVWLTLKDVLLGLKAFSLRLINGKLNSS